MLWPPGDGSVAALQFVRRFEGMPTHASVTAVVQCSEKPKAVIACGVGVVLQGVAELKVVGPALRACPYIGVCVIGGRDVASAGEN